MNGVSIITCTNRQNYLNNLLQNYSRQRYAQKELIIVINNNTIPLLPYQHLAKKHKNIKIFRKPEHQTLGSCLNFAVTKCKYPTIAKFDDDDYYAPHYLTESLQTLNRTNADILGKRAHYMYLSGSKTLILRFPHDEHQTVTHLPGATLVFKRRVFEQVKFPNKNVGEDDLFCSRSRKKGYKVYSASKNNFVAIRRKNSSKHTWIISDKTLIANHKIIRNIKNYKAFVGRSPKIKV
ncbi:glycosyltransferase [Paenibacillus sp. FSL R10-2734]|uniref:glycosyltransferase n=1 Tax=Paenibacillus sp. FSL R10-2734 TaxID=2954691 RepID=UPI0030DBA54C